jgi:Protein of unknown function with PCYCGC motif
MFKGSKGTVALVVGALAVVAIAYLGSGYIGHAGQTDTAEAANRGQCCLLHTSDVSGEQSRVTLDPKRFQGEVREAYEVAANDPALLVQLHCYCGCDKEFGHKSLLDCFRDEHGSKCAICVGEARDAETMANRGVPVEQIRDTLRSRYAHGS